jgi:hypothetical protein
MDNATNKKVTCVQCEKTAKHYGLCKEHHGRYVKAIDDMAEAQGITKEMRPEFIAKRWKALISIGKALPKKTRASEAQQEALTDEERKALMLEAHPTQSQAQAEAE